jgi:hypothetical protein
VRACVELVTRRLAQFGRDVPSLHTELWTGEDTLTRTGAAEADLECAPFLPDSTAAAALGVTPEQAIRYSESWTYCPPVNPERVPAGQRVEIGFQVGGSVNAVSVPYRVLTRPRLVCREGDPTP